MLFRRLAVFRAGLISPGACAAAAGGDVFSYESFVDLLSLRWQTSSTDDSDERATAR